MLTKNFDFHIPPELISVNPSQPRGTSKIVEVAKNFSIFNFDNLLEILNKGDCLIINNTKVIPAQLEGFCEGKKVSVTLNKRVSLNTNIWSAFAKPLKKIIKKKVIDFSNNFFAEIIDINKDRQGEIFLNYKYDNNTFTKLLKNHATLAIPPYILKKRSFKRSDYKNYQTIFAEKNGAVASPTASLHFDEILLKKIKKKGIKIVKVTLHINGGTFLPIKTQNINDHVMHHEYGEISKESADIINNVKLGGNKCIAVGTTVLRLLETAKNKYGKCNEFKGETNIFIKPGWLVNSVDGIITNFHTPKSTLFVLICTLIGIKKAKELYSFAIKNKLNFFSYGDACLIWIKNDK